MKRHLILCVLVAATVLAGCQHAAEVDPRLRAHADGLNREAFVNRYRNPEHCIARAEEALTFMHDSLPTYVDGRLRAYNVMAFAYYQMSKADEAERMLAKVEAERGSGSPNADIEWVISSLIKARLLQRSCQIAESYRLLYEVGLSGVLEHKRDDLLYNYAQTEYYITMLTLNFHYRDGKQSSVLSLVDEVEQRRQRLKVDYAQDMALNYALAYGLQSAGEHERALDYCDDNFDILLLDDAFFCPFHYANTLQMEALVLRSMPGPVPPDSILALYDEAREVFYEYGDPYQVLGGVSSTARYALLIGDTAKAHEVLKLWLGEHSIWTPFSAPKMELSFFEVLIRSRVADSPDQNRRWFEHYCELREYVARNEKADFVLQNTLDTATRRNRWMTAFAITLGALLVVLLALVVVLWRGAERLRREKRQIEEANRRDVERIANVETCLSVLRHDVTPFVGYLRNEQLPDELRSEVIEQLLRTFDNLKNWTRLSIPKGLAFTPTVFALGEVLEEVRQQVIVPSAEVEVRFDAEGVSLWGDRLLTIILLRNLVNNALQHTQRGKVEVGAKRVEGNMVDIAVSDTGEGMTEEQCEMLFRADREVPAGAEHGFGMILCRYIIKRHDDNTRRGCKIWVESTVGKGTTVWCRMAEGSEVVAK